MILFRDTLPKSKANIRGVTVYCRKPKPNIILRAIHKVFFKTTWHDLSEPELMQFIFNNTDNLLVGEDDNGTSTRAN